MVLTVAIALIRHGERVLVTRRAREADHLPGVLEFPGGKVEPNETIEAAARREAFEETGLRVEVVHQRAAIVWDYASRRVRLHPCDCVLSPGASPDAAKGSWCSIAQLKIDDFPPANAALIAELQRENKGVASSQDNA